MVPGLDEIDCWLASRQVWVLPVRPRFCKNAMLRRSHVWNVSS